MLNNWVVCVAGVERVYLETRLVTLQGPSAILRLMQVCGRLYPEMIPGRMTDRINPHVHSTTAARILQQ